VFFFDPRNPILPADDQEITSPFRLVSDIMMLLKDAVICASPTDSTITFLFFDAVLAIVKDYLVAFFLLATVLRFPLRVRELFLVRCPLKGSPAL